MRLSVIFAVFGFVAFTACGGAGKENPRAVAEAVAGYMSDGDMNGVVGLMPPGSVLADSVDCSKAGFDMVEKLEKAKAKYIAKAARHPEKLEGLTFAVKEFDLEGSKDKVIAAGDDFEGCVATKEIKLHSARLTLSVTKDGKADDDGESWRFIQLDGKWYFAKM